MCAFRVRRAVCIVLAAGTGVAGSSPGAAAKPKLPSRTVQCGDVLTESLRVANNLRDCPGDGLVVGAPGITIDLGGHRVDGVSVADSAGIHNDAGHDGVEIRNGVLSGFYDGVRLQGASGNTLTLLNVLGNVTGIRLVGSTGNSLKDNAATGNAIGVRLDASSNDNLLAMNDASGNDDGFYVEASSGNVFTGNTASGNRAYGIENFAASGNTFKGNVTSGNDFDGIILDSSSSDGVLKGNRASANDLNGIEVVGGSGNVLSGNSAQENGLNGFLSDTNALALTRNKANGNGFLGGGGGDDVGLGISVPAGATSSGNKAAGNDDPNECKASDLGCHVP